MDGRQELKPHRGEDAKKTVEQHLAEVNRHLSFIEQQNGITLEYIRFLDLRQNRILQQLGFLIKKDRQDREVYQLTGTVSTPVEIPARKA